MVLEVNGQREQYEVKNVLEFTSVRKRMSVIVRFPDGSLRLISKGADSELIRRLDKSRYSQSILHPRMSIS